MDGEFGWRDYREESWINYHEDQQNVYYQYEKESDSTWKKQTHQNEAPLSSRASGREKLNLEHYKTENQITDIMTKGV